MSKCFSAEVTKRSKEFFRVRFPIVIRCSLLKKIVCTIIGNHTLILSCFNLPELCQPGYFSASGFDSFTEPCAPCPTGTYSYLSGTKQCLPCPDNSSTKTTGATSSDDCFGKCFVLIFRNIVKLKVFIY